MTGYKTYNDGEVLTASDLNDYLQQGVLRYASKAARDSDLSVNAREGMVAYAQDNDVISYYNGTGWSDLAQTAITNAVVSTSPTGSATIDGILYDYWRYTSSGNFVVTTAGFVDVLVVGGGGGSSNIWAGGAGGVNFQERVYVKAETIPVIVGAGGAGVLAFDVNSYPFPSFNGNSSAFGSQAIAVGGGGAGNFGNTGGSGGSSNGSGTPSQGNAGGSGAYPGGGGAGQAGQAGNAVTGDGGDGGDGLQYNMTGTPTYFGGGGGGGAQADAGGVKGIGGLGGGGNGSDTATSGQAGAANTGGGAGGGAVSAGGFGYYGNNGGSGIVIIRIPQ